MKNTAKLVGVIKVQGGVKETTWAQEQFMYSRVKLNKEQEVIAVETVVKEEKKVTVDIPVFNTTQEEEYTHEYTYTGESMDDILDRLDKKAAQLEKDKQRDALITKLDREHKRKWAPKNKAQKLMDAVGIDRYEVVRMINDIERRMK